MALNQNSFIHSFVSDNKLYRKVSKFINIVAFSNAKYQKLQLNCSKSKLTQNTNTIKLFKSKSNEIIG